MIRRLPSLILANAILFAAMLAPSQAAVPTGTPGVLTGEISEQHVRELTSQINWQTDLKQAEELARQQGKLVFWVHMVGKIDGAT